MLEDPTKSVLSAEAIYAERQSQETFSLSSKLTRLKCVTGLITKPLDRQMKRGSQYILLLQNDSRQKGMYVIDKPDKASNDCRRTGHTRKLGLVVRNIVDGIVLLLAVGTLGDATIDVSPMIAILSCTCSAEICDVIEQDIFQYGSGNRNLTLRQDTKT
jgi:hypothetical protein